MQVESCWLLLAESEVYRGARDIRDIRDGRDERVEGGSSAWEGAILLDGKIGEKPVN